MAKPLLLDLFCRAGGCTKGYQRAGFRVVGVDIEPQPRYCGDAFRQSDAIALVDILAGGGGFVASDGQEYRLDDFDAIHASPPCQVHCALSHFATPGKHLDLVPQTREGLNRTGKPYVIENTPGAPLNVSLILCGTMFRLATPCGAELQRHRWFELNWGLVDLVPLCDHGWSVRDGKPKNTVAVVGGGAQGGRRSASRTIFVSGHQAQTPGMKPRRVKVITVTGSTSQQNVVRNKVRETFTVAATKVAMGIDWMSRDDLSQAIPPPYCEFIGRQLLQVLGVGA